MKIKYFAFFIFYEVKQNKYIILVCRNNYERQDLRDEKKIAVFVFNFGIDNDNTSGGLWGPGRK